MNDPLEPDEPHALIQFAVVMAFALFYLALVLAWAH